MNEPKILNVDDLKVGDFVASKESLYYGWNTWFCDTYKILKITRITPKRTKICFAKTALEINPKITPLYEVTEEIREYIKLTSEQKELADFMYRYAREIDNSARHITGIRGFVKSLSDEERTRYIADFRKPYSIMERYKGYVLEKDKGGDLK